MPQRRGSPRHPVDKENSELMSPWSFENQMTAMQTVADHMGEWMR
ncbi:hypothetical protein [Actinomyces gerencseriae]|nr:hypothetical protein [Actinomyces gerencseriae]